MAHGKLQGKVALVTGGTTGIGFAAARLFADEGAAVVATGSNPATLEEARRRFEGRVEVVASDAADPQAIQALATRIGAQHGGVDVAFVNAGIGQFAPLAAHDEAAFDRMFAVNVKGPWLLLQALEPHLRAGASVVLNTSVVGQKGLPNTSIYSASKAALRSLARTLAAEWLERGIRVNAIAPGPVTTPIYGKLGMPAEALGAFEAQMAALNPMKRFGTPEEIARAVLFFASSDASYITGAELAVDGGLAHL